MGWFFDQSINEFLQDLFPEWLEKIFLGITFLGEAIIYILLLAIAFWIFNKKDAIIAIYVFLTTTFLNFFLKVLIQKPRPSTSIRLQDVEGFSTPSGHAQGSTTIYGWIMFYFKKIWLYILVPTLILLICFSRVLLGVHYIGDVILGFLIGATLLGMLYFGIPPLLKWVEKWPMWVKILAGEIYGIVVFIMTFIPGILANWPSHEESSNLADIVSVLMVIPVFFWIENKWIKMNNDNLVWYSIILRISIGAVVLIGAYFGLSFLFDMISLEPMTNYYAKYTVEFFLRFIRYTIVVAFAGLGIPLLFSRVKIFNHKRIEKEDIIETVVKV
ncbi:MAG: phosphatase PAP2 family protein [Candidatus Heimdallarchaeota archaeon]|nr:phosphatase PAP2 family protein [Candidatus Heimdallarchaeota archaeon]